MLDPLDERFLSDGGDAGATTTTLISKQFGSFTNQAIGALAKYDTATFYDTSAVDSAQSKVYRGRCTRWKGMPNSGWRTSSSAQGVPLSTLDYGQDFTVSGGVDDDSISIRMRVAKFDTALTFGDDLTSSVQNLARVGKGRALALSGAV